ncbi:MAG: FAD-dependent thymidylate synthase [Prevotella sp.]
MTHVELQPDLLPLLGRVDNVLDGIAGFVEHYDFSRANSSYEARVQAITKVASICYANPKSLGSISLFDRLQAESGGLPSSSYEFIPVLLEQNQVIQILTDSASEAQPADVAIIKFGTWLSSNHLLTNLRALIEMVGPEASLNYLNTSEEEIQIIRDNFKVFLFNVDLSTRAQMVRHRVSWQELSRRYVSGTKSPFEFYRSRKLENHVSYMEDTKGIADNLMELSFSTEDIIDVCLNHYFKALDSGVKREEARRILPQAMMTQIWGAFQPSQLDNWFKLRLDKHAQSEIRMVAQAMQELINGN